jgi:molybdate transport system permease protein
MSIDWSPLWLSLRVAAISTLVSVVLGVALAWLLAHRNFRGRDVLDAGVMLPLVLPPTVLGYYLLVLLGRQSALGQIYESVFGQPLVFTWQAAVVAAMFHSLPLLVKWSRSALESVDHSYEWAARSLGASEWRTFWRVSLPLAGRSILAAAALSFARALGDSRPNPNRLGGHLRCRGIRQRDIGPDPGHRGLAHGHPDPDPG